MRLLRSSADTPLLRASERDCSADITSEGTFRQDLQTNPYMRSRFAVCW